MDEDKKEMVEDEGYLSPAEAYEKAMEELRIEKEAIMRVLAGLKVGGIVDGTTKDD